jgi:hypothetical protein
MTSKHKNSIHRRNNIDHSSIPSGSSTRCLQNYDIPASVTSTRASCESISRYYGHLRTGEGNTSDLDINSCFALRLAMYLIETISSGSVTLTRSGAFNRSFYICCIESAAVSELAGEISDPELLVIYIKQCLHLLKASGIVRCNGSRAAVDPAATSKRTVYFRLFNAFWNNCRWEDIFPSDTASARALSDNKDILKDLLVRHEGAVRLDGVANEFFDMTGFCNKNDLFMISFLDFYFFTWLNHFGMIQYSEGRETSPVHITVTGTGRKILKSF